MLGIDHRTATIAHRERVAFAPGELPTALRDLAAIAPEGLILSTCNRIEIYALLDRPSPDSLRWFLAMARPAGADELDDIATLRSGEQAVSHFLRVSTGMASMMLGEPHILAQLRQALDAAREAGSLGPILSRLGAEALRVGKRARSETGISRDGASIPRATLDRATVHFGSLAGCRTVVLGAGQMGGHSARLLAEAGVADLVILNRTATRAEALARSLGCRFGGLSDRERELARADLVVSAANLPDAFMVDAAALRGRGGDPLLIVDLGLPRTVEPALHDLAGITLCDVDDLDDAAMSRQEARTADLDAVAAMIDETVADFLRWWEERQAAPTIAAMRAQAEAIREQELERALRRLGSLSERDREVVSALSVAVVNKLMHGPMTRVKADRGRMEPAAQALFGLSPDHRS